MCGEHHTVERQASVLEGGIRIQNSPGWEMIQTKWQCFSQGSDLSLYWAQVCPETASPQFAQQLQVQQSVCPATAK